MKLDSVVIALVLLFYLDWWLSSFPFHRRSFHLFPSRQFDQVSYSSSHSLASDLCRLVVPRPPTIDSVKSTQSVRAKVNNRPSCQQPPLRSAASARPPQSRPCHRQLRPDGRWLHLMRSADKAPAFAFLVACSGFLSADQRQSAEITSCCQDNSRQSRWPPTSKSLLTARNMSNVR